MNYLTQGDTVSGKIAFELYDTYGFPIDLTRLMATEVGWKVDEKGFEAEMKKQKERSPCGYCIGYRRLGDP